MRRLFYMFLFLALLVSCKNIEKTESKQVVEKDLKAVMNEKVGKVVQNLFEIGKLENTTISIGQILNEKNEIDSVSNLLSNYLEEGITKNSRNINLIERSRLKELVNEWKLGLSGMVDEETSSQAGKILGIKNFIFAKYSINNKNLDVRFKIVDGETSETISVINETFLVDDTIAIKKMKTENKDIKTDNQKLSISLWSDKNSYFVGENLKLYFKSNKDCYIYLFNINANGEAAMIFPNNFKKSNIIDGNKEYVFPSDDMVFDFKIGEPKGFDIIKVIVTSKPEVDLVKLMENIHEENPFKIMESNDFLTLRTVTAQLKENKSTDFSNASIKIKIE